MYRYNKPKPTTIRVNKSYTGERIEEKVNRILNNKEPIKDSAPIIYTDRKDGVMPAYDIRTDRFELAVEATDAITKSNLAKRDHFAKMGEEAKRGMEAEKKTDKEAGGTASSGEGGA